MTIRNVTLIAAAGGAGGRTCRCWDSTEVVVHNPGEYKGEQDPLLAQAASARTETLTKRFQLVQADR